MTPRIGLGFDVHRLEPGRPCVLGGVRLPHPAGPLGHSDGDAVLHALADALLGAAGLEDLGTLCPDTDPRYAGADSSELLAGVVEHVHAAGLRVGNADLVIVTDGPRIAPHREAMRARIAALLAVPPAAVNLKGKTLERAPGESPIPTVTVHAVCLLFDAT